MRALPTLRGDLNQVAPVLLMLLGEAVFHQKSLNSGYALRLYAEVHADDPAPHSQKTHRDDSSPVRPDGQGPLESDSSAHR